MNLNQLNILMADDDHDDCLFFKQALEELNTSAHLTTVHDGEELMDYLNKVGEQNSGQPNGVPQPDILFLDINMPRKNGMECLAEIKRNEKLRDLPVVMFSTSNSWDTIKMSFKGGSDVYIHKPSNFSQLKQVIHHALPIAIENKYSNIKVKYILNA